MNTFLDCPENLKKICTVKGKKMQVWHGMCRTLSTIFSRADSSGIRVGRQRPRAAGQRHHHRQSEAHFGARSGGPEDHQGGLRLLAQRGLDHRWCDYALRARAGPFPDRQGLAGGVLSRWGSRLYICSGHIFGLNLIFRVNKWASSFVDELKS